MAVLELTRKNWYDFALCMMSSKCSPLLINEFTLGFVFNLWMKWALVQVASHQASSPKSSRKSFRSSLVNSQVQASHKSKYNTIQYQSYLVYASYNKKASIHWQDSALPISGYWPTSELNAGDHDFPLTSSNFGNLTAFRAIFSYIFTAHAQERPFMNFRFKFWHHHSIL